MLDVDHVSVQLPLVTWILAAYTVAVLVIVRRGWYPPWFRTVIPLFDVVLISVGFWNAAAVIGWEEFRRIGGLATVAAACAFLALAGGLRLSRGSSVVSTAGALAVYGYFGTRLQDTSTNFGIQVALLAVCGAAGSWIGSIVTRATRSAVARAALTRFLPSHVVEKAHFDPASIVTAPRSGEATVLVSDLRGFTSLAETMSPPLVLEFLNEVQSRLAEEVRKHGGVVDKFMGDGMLAVFGAPEALEGHAAAALRAARAMFVAVAQVNERRRAQGLSETALGIGVHTGPLISGVLGGGARLEFTVLGDTVNTAARLQSLTKEMEVALLASAKTAEAAGAEADGLVPRGQVPIRGRSATLAVWALPR
jgi:class 3 adenylate cyclase